MLDLFSETTSDTYEQEKAKLENEMSQLKGSRNTLFMRNINFHGNIPHLVLTNLECKNLCCDHKIVNSYNILENYNFDIISF